jgi:predicted CXXCH cytochrome family protein
MRGTVNRELKKRVTATIMRIQERKDSREHMTAKQDIEPSNPRTLESFLIVIALLVIALPSYAANTFKLKEGAKAQLCIECHKDIQETLKSPFVHAPLKRGECSGCHNPHTSEHGKLLGDEINSLCNNCHKDVIPEKTRSIHKVVADGKCVSCHDPHASGNKFVLRKKGNDLCFECHKDMGSLIENAEYKHEPVEKNQGCITCHNPHASADYKFILKNDSPSLCAECHRTDEKKFADRHLNYPVADSQCTSCHNPHGSNTRKIIFDGAHEPVVKRECDKCHEGSQSQNPLNVLKEGIELCRGCHSEAIDKMFGKNQVHWPLVDSRACMHCHSPHAARQKNLVKGKIVNVCGECHEDTLSLQKISIDNPENKSLCKPVKEGNCIDCHTPHSSDGPLLIAEESFSFGTCNKCHEWRSHSTHPIGDKIVDPRNENLMVDCLSCHRACGTGNNPSMMPFSSTYILCIQCHTGYRR